MAKDKRAGLMPWWFWAVLLGAGAGFASRYTMQLLAGRPMAAARSRGQAMEIRADASDITGMIEIIQPEQLADLPAAEQVPAAAIRPADIRAESDGGVAGGGGTNFQVQESGAGVAAARAPASPPSTTEPPPPTTMRSSWHAEDFRQRCGGMEQALAKQTPLWADRQPVVWRCGCKESGLGDRLKGITAAWMLAMVLQRPFACEVFPSMVELEYGVEPVLVDWRTRYQDYVKSNPWSKAAGRARWSNRADSVMNSPDATNYGKAIEISQTTPAKIGLLTRFIREVLGGDPAILATETYVGDGKDFTSDDQTNSSHPFRAAIAHAHFCASRALFRPTPKLLTLLDQSLAEASNGLPPALSLGGGAVAEPLVVGVHARFGGRWKDRKRAKDTDVNNIVSCAWNMSRIFRAQNPRRGVVWLLASDQIERLSGLIDKFAEEVVGRAPWDEAGVSPWASKTGIIEHVVKSANGSEVAATQRLWLDWFLMSEVHTCALIRSSFPRTACYVSARRDAGGGLIQQLVTRWDLGRYPRIIPRCTSWTLEGD